jgi:drug/metabolite transporter (DMT)-like permease
MVTTKLITKRVEKTVILFYLGLASALCGTAGLFSVGRPSNPAVWEWVVAVSVGVLGLVQQYCLVYAVHLESPSRVSVVRQLQIVIAYVVQVHLHGRTGILGIAQWVTVVAHSGDGRSSVGDGRSSVGDGRISVG